MIINMGMSSDAGVVAIKNLIALCACAGIVVHIRLISANRTTATLSYDVQRKPLIKRFRISDLEVGSESDFVHLNNLWTKSVESVLMAAPLLLQTVAKSFISHRWTRIPQINDVNGVVAQ